MVKKISNYEWTSIVAYADGMEYLLSHDMYFLQDLNERTNDYILYFFHDRKDEEIPGTICVGNQRTIFLGILIQFVPSITNESIKFAPSITNESIKVWKTLHLSLTLLGQTKCRFR